MNPLVNPRLKFDVDSFATIDRATQAAINLAEILEQLAGSLFEGLYIQPIVEFDFNDVTVLVCANDQPREVVSAYQDVLRNGERIKRVGPLRLNAVRVR